jgi:L-malate glycosyltransferase
VYPHVLEIGGSQLNAVELAAGVRELGHEVVLVGRPGPLLGRVAELDLEFVELPEPRRRPSPTVVSALSALVRRRGLDLVHGYEWTAGLESYLAARRTGTSTVCTVMSMAVAPFLPRDQPLVVGTDQIARACVAEGRQRVHVLEPPIDLRHNDSVPQEALDEFRGRFGIRPEGPTLVMVTRFAAALKLEGILAAVDVVGELADEQPVQLVLVGDGPEAGVVRERVAAANVGRPVPAVILTGELEDPRPAYAVSDICLGMGGSALRAMAFGKPVVVQGERGFWLTLTPATADGFLWTGWYGVGDDAARGRSRLADALRPLLGDPAARKSLGSYSRELVEERFSLERAARLQEQIYLEALAARSRDGAQVGPMVRCASRFLGYKVAQRGRRWRGVAAADDFNAVPVAARQALGVSAGSGGPSS